jgi:phage terminase large subunit GpA-like protein
MINSSPSTDGFADAGKIVAQCLAAFIPPARISTADYAAGNRYLANEGGGYVGRWNHDKAPYLVGIMDALDRIATDDGEMPEHTTVALVKPAQCGGTATAENWLLHNVGADPADMLWYMQVKDTLEAYVKKTINPMIESHPVLQQRLGGDRTDNSLSFKRFTGMSIEFLAATLNNVKSKRAGRIVADEWDSYDLDDADPKTLLDSRRQTYGRESMLFALSHCDKAQGTGESDWKKGVMALYRESDRRIWVWECPHCRMWSSPNPGAPKHMAIEYDAEKPLEEIEATAHLVCPHNGCLIEDQERNAMNLTGRWMGSGQEIDFETGIVTGKLTRRAIAGFWIVGAMSPFILGGIGHLARERAKAERELAGGGSDASLKEVIVKQWGFPYQPGRSVATLDAAVLAGRADRSLPLGLVPGWVMFLTAAIDVQGNRFEYLVRGWGRDRVSIVIHYEKIMADPATSASDWDDLLARLARAEFPLADGSGRVMKVRGIGIDAYGLPGVTPQAFDAWRRFKIRRQIRLVGNFSGRDAYTIMPLKGGTSLFGNPLTVSYPDTVSKQRRTGSRGDVPVGMFNPNWFKDQLQTQLTLAESGPGYVHFPGGLLAEKEPHPFFEQLVSERRLPTGRWEKPTSNTRNEPWDLMVMCGVMAHLFAPSRFNWERPPAWAQPHETNSLVGAPSAEAIAPGAGRPDMAGRGRPLVLPPAPASPPGRAPAPPMAAVRPMTMSERIRAAREARQGA